MKKFILDFIRRGLMACGFGPVVLAAVYLILSKTAIVETLGVDQVCIGIFSLTALAFLAGGMNAIYQMERLPLLLAILIHGIVLYLGYLGAFLLNDWLEWGRLPVLVFTGVFAVGYLVIWMVIYFIIRRNTRKLNENLKKRQQNTDAL